MNTFRESVRDKIFYSLLVFAFIILCFSIILGKLSMGEGRKIIQDFGLMALSLFGTLTAIFVGIGMLYKEMEKRTIYVILSKPVSRWQFLVGKYAGLSLTLLVMETLMTLCMFAICLLQNGKVPWNVLYAIVATAFELQLILAVALLFSSFTTPFLSGLFTLSVFVIGHITVDLKEISETLDDALLKNAADLFYHLFPNLERLNFKAEAVHNLHIPFTEFSTAIVYAVSYTLIILMISAAIFNRHDMK